MDPRRFSTGDFHANYYRATSSSLSHCRERRCSTPDVLLPRGAATQGPAAAAAGTAVSAASGSVSGEISALGPAGVRETQSSSSSSRAEVAELKAVLKLEVQGDGSGQGGGMVSRAAVTAVAVDSGPAAMERNSGEAAKAGAKPAGDGSSRGEDEHVLVEGTVIGTAGQQELIAFSDIGQSKAEGVTAPQDRESRSRVADAALQGYSSARAEGIAAAVAGPGAGGGSTRPACVPPLSLTRASMEEVDTILHLLEQVELPSTQSPRIGSPRRLLQQQQQQQHDAGGVVCLTCSSSSAFSGSPSNIMNSSGSLGFSSQAGTPRRMGVSLPGDWVGGSPNQDRHQQQQQQLRNDVYQQQSVVGGQTSNGSLHQQQPVTSPQQQLLSCAQRRCTTTDLGVLHVQRAPSASPCTSAAATAGCAAGGGTPSASNRRVSGTGSNAGGSRGQAASWGGGFKGSVGFSGSRPVSSSSGGSRGGGSGNGARKSSSGNGAGSGSGGGGSNGVLPEVLLAREWQSQGLHWQQSLRTAGIASLLTRPLGITTTAVVSGPSNGIPAAVGGASVAGRRSSGCGAGAETACCATSAGGVGELGATIGLGAASGVITRSSSHAGSRPDVAADAGGLSGEDLTPTRRPPSSSRQPVATGGKGVAVADSSVGSRPALPRIRALSWGTSTRKRG